MKKLFWICLVVLMSCELIVDVDVPYEGDKIVLNAIQGAPGPWTVELTNTKYILDAGTGLSFDPIQMAEVTIFEEDGTSYPLNHSSPGYYISDKHPREGGKYKIVVRANGFTGVDAEMTVPRAVKITNVEWDSTGIDPNPPPTQPNRPPGPYFVKDTPLKVTFTDPPDVNNHYAVLVHLDIVRSYNDPQTQQQRTDSMTSVIRTWSTDPAIAREDDRKMRFPDTSFAGTTYTASTMVQLRNSPDQRIYRVSVVLVALSEEYFRYEESRELYFQNSGDPFAQPVQTFTNVNNGLGVFGGYALDRVSWDR
jgi:hypothetical protein